jgi:hypothetical protein
MAAPSRDTWGPTLPLALQSPQAPLSGWAQPCRRCRRHEHGHACNDGEETTQRSTDAHRLGIVRPSQCGYCALVIQMDRLGCPLVLGSWPP